METPPGSGALPKVRGGGREHFGQLAPRAPGKHRLHRTQVPPPRGGRVLRGRSPRHATLTPATAPPAARAWVRGRGASSSLGLPEACAVQAALPQVPDPALPLPLPGPASPHYPGGDHDQRLSSGGQRRGAYGPREPSPPWGTSSAQDPLLARAAGRSKAARPGLGLWAWNSAPAPGSPPGVHSPQGRGPASRPRARLPGGGAF